MLAAKKVAMRSVLFSNFTSSGEIERTPTWTSGNPSSTTRAITLA